MLDLSQVKMLMFRKASQKPSTMPDHRLVQLLVEAPLGVRPVLAESI